MTIVYKKLLMTAVIIGLPMSAISAVHDVAFTNSSGISSNGATVTVNKPNPVLSITNNIGATTVATEDGVFTPDGSFRITSGNNAAFGETCLTSIVSQRSGEATNYSSNIKYKVTDGGEIGMSAELETLNDSVIQDGCYKTDNLIVSDLVVPLDYGYGTYLISVWANGYWR